MRVCNGKAVLQIVAIEIDHSRFDWLIEDPDERQFKVD